MVAIKLVVHLIRERNVRFEVIDAAAPDAKLDNETNDTLYQSLLHHSKSILLASTALGKP